MRFDIITIFPSIFDGFVSESLLAKAQKKKLLAMKAHYLRNWTTDRHQTVDGKPYGGGPGLVFKVEPILKAVNDIRKSFRSKASGRSDSESHQTRTRSRTKSSKVILFSPRGKKFTTALAKKWSKLDQLIFICGRYEGVDERVADYIADEVVSVGEYVLNGGEVAAMAVIESVARLLPGFMHDKDSQSKEDHAQYTKPETVTISGKKRSVPKVLLSGNHKKIEVWRKKHSTI